MELQYYKIAVAAAWVLVMSTIGVIVGVTSAPALAAYAVFTLLPPAVMLRVWIDPPQTLSETINQARR